MQLSKNAGPDIPLRRTLMLMLLSACSTGESASNSLDIPIQFDGQSEDLVDGSSVLDEELSLRMDSHREDRPPVQVEDDGGTPEPDSPNPDGGPEELDAADTNSVLSLPVMVVIPAGTFVMGSPIGEPGQDASEELPQHSVTLTRAFEMQATEVLQSEWVELMGNNPSRFTGCGLDCPVEQVSWWDSIAYLNALSELAGYAPCYELQGCSGAPGSGLACGAVIFLGLDCEGYRLPTEAEWEYAARAGSDEAIYTGSVSVNGYCDAPELSEIAWFCGNSVASYEGAADCPAFPDLPSDGTCGSQAAAQKPATSWGVHDILGNVGEWTWDRFGETYYQVSPELDPIGAFSGNRQVARGCSWRNGAGDCRAAARGDFGPGATWDFLGFRPVRTFVVVPD